MNYKSKITMKKEFVYGGKGTYFTFSGNSKVYITKKEAMQLIKNGAINKTYNL